MTIREKFFGLTSFEVLYAVVCSAEVMDGLRLYLGLEQNIGLHRARL